MSATSYKGIVRGKTVVLPEEANLPEGMGVLVTPLPTPQGAPQAVLDALKTSRPVSPEAAEELRRLIRQGKRSARFDDPFARRE